MAGKKHPRARRRPAAYPLRTRRFNLRASAAQHRIIRAAATASGKTLSEFILDSACRAADNVRLDQTSLRLNPTQWRKFVAALDRPTKDKPRLRALLSRPGPFDGS